MSIENITEMYERYHSFIRITVDEIEEKIKSGEAEVADISDLVSATSDDCEWVIYTYKARAALLFSDNHNAINDLGVGPISTDDNMWVEKIASWAINQDLMDEVERRGLFELEETE